MQEPSITLVIPVYNEAASLPTTMPEFIDYCQRQNWKLIIVNDGSTDATKRILSTYEKHDYMTILHHKVNRGYGGAIKTAIAHVDTEFFVTVDADGQHQLADIDALYEACLCEDADMVIGSRGKQRSSLYREIGKWLIRKIIRILMPISIHDVNSGMKFFRTKLAKRYASLCPDSMAFSDVITLIFISERHLVKEYPITVKGRLAGESTITTKTAFETVLEILNIITLFNPMRLFLPLSFASLLVGILWGFPLVLQGRGVSVGAMLAITTGIIGFFLGLIAEQLSLLRKSKTY
jgi:glycosyltransferase involved in cell wall biosynthesis